MYVPTGGEVMSNLHNIPWYLVLGFVLVAGISVVWTIEMVWKGLTGRK